MRTGEMKGVHFDVAIQLNPTNFIRSGDYIYSSGGIANRNNIGYFWQSKDDTANNARNLNFYSTGLYPSGTLARGMGFSLRCLAARVSRQLPTYSGTKSYQNLLVEVYETHQSYWDDRAPGKSTMVINKPFNLLPARYYSDGNVVNSILSHYITSTGNGELVFNLDLYYQYIHIALTIKNLGFALRCLVR